MSFFTNLRRVNKVYPNNNQFVLDNLQVINTAPPGFSNILSNPISVNIGDRFLPGYNIGNNTLVSTADVNRVMRNNDVGGIRSIFTNANNNQINSLGQLRRVDNVPDAGLHSNNIRRNAVKDNFPETNTRTTEGVQNVLNQNPSLNNYLTNLKTAGVAVLLGAGVYLIFSAATLVQDIIAALNRVGGSYYIRGKNGGEEADICLLVNRTCLMQSNLNNQDVVFCQFDPLIQDADELQNICQDFNYEIEKTVCRASDPNADPNSLQYVDISDLGVGQTITCIEPYNMGDLIGDLGLDYLLGDNGLVANSSNVSKFTSDKLLPLILIIGGILLLAFVSFFIFKTIMNNNTINSRPYTEPIPTNDRR
ncbi:occlusion derived viral protein-e56 [Apocheima cinerarium nucleopolyhedrovirus]|uniref:occlusion derived viral protein-e56 n=1 Tax=Apocheima cinerarium nucleopolyhedrovirus TaxID=307461 RepID=UPI0001D920D7|nr:occlusion derived viral protein-e56 [Apocheima cinerarium nucleopolyhedrovirus]ADB84476.1 occlusion derived viral protein-e56 [Apocheima cinerarium nucleopolyhedrovirus]